MFHVYLHRGIKNVGIRFQDWGNNWKDKGEDKVERAVRCKGFVRVKDWIVNMMNWFGLYLIFRKYGEDYGGVREEFYSLWNVVISSSQIILKFTNYEFTCRYIICDFLTVFQKFELLEDIKKKWNQYISLIIFVIGYVVIGHFIEYRSIIRISKSLFKYTYHKSNFNNIWLRWKWNRKNIQKRSKTFVSEDIFNAIRQKCNRIKSISCYQRS